MKKNKLIQYFCPNCHHQWCIVPGHYNLKPSGRKPGKCYCGKKFPVVKKKVGEKD